MKIGKVLWLSIITFALIIVFSTLMTFAAETGSRNLQNNFLLSDPFLQLPTRATINVVWFTDFLGNSHLVKYGNYLEKQVEANTRKLSQVREDTDSQLNYAPSKKVIRDIWRHEATILGLKPNQRLPYQVVSIKNKHTIASEVFTLAGQPPVDTPLKILLTSDHQLMPMTTANLEQVIKTVGQVDAVFFPGDLVNTPDRASEWFDDLRGGAFFPALQGKANYELESNGIKTIYQGGEIIQHAPLFTAIGNHEVMGQRSDMPALKLKEEFNQPFPRKVATEVYQAIADKINPNNDPQIKTEWIKNNSFNTDTYEEIFSLPQSTTGGSRYYATTFGDIRLIALYVTSIWRSPSLEANEKSRFKESNLDLEQPDSWGYGQHIFESIAKDSPQYKWLQQELASPAYQQAKYKIVMLHHPPHTLGGNIVPPYTDPQPKLYYDEAGKLSARYYDYPIADDYIIRDLIPLLESADVQLVYYGHSHLWNRFQSTSGMNFLESSNVGNSYGAHTLDNPRPVPTYSPENYIATGNPNGLEPIVPSIAPLIDQRGKPLPYIASNDITVFSIFDTEQGTVSSYRYDIRTPNLPAIKFDEFRLI